MADFNRIPWHKQHCGVHQAPFWALVELMPDLEPVLTTFPDHAPDFTWDVKVHMLMPGQYPCVPNWHFDNIPRDADGKQDFSRVRLDLPMYLWVSGSPLTEFRTGGFVEPQTWTRFTQADEHRGTSSTEHCWRGFIRATHCDIMPWRKLDTATDYQRRHCQVYLDAATFKW